MSLPSDIGLTERGMRASKLSPGVTWATISGLDTVAAMLMMITEHGLESDG